MAKGRVVHNRLVNRQWVLGQLQKCHIRRCGLINNWATLTCMKTIIILLLTAAISGAQAPPEDQGLPQETRAREYWIDPSTGLMWAAKDNGRNVNWNKAMKYCREMRLAGYSDWKLATLAELEGIYDSGANAPGLARLGGPAMGSDFTWHVKGNLFLTGNQWSSSRRLDDRGKPSGYAWRFDFNEGRSFGGDEESFSTNKRALCVRNSSR